MRDSSSVLEMCYYHMWLVEYMYVIYVWDRYSGVIYWFNAVCPLTVTSEYIYENICNTLTGELGVFSMVIPQFIIDWQGYIYVEWYWQYLKPIVTGSHRQSSSQKTPLWQMNSRQVNHWNRNLPVFKHHFSMALISIHFCLNPMNVQRFNFRVPCVINLPWHSPSPASSLPILGKWHVPPSTLAEHVPWPASKDESPSVTECL